jgi:hypothetical protein
MREMIMGVYQDMYRLQQDIRRANAEILELQVHLSLVHELVARQDSLLEDLKSLREFVVGCAEFSDKVVVRVDQLERKKNVKVSKKRKGK